MDLNTLTKALSDRDDAMLGKLAALDVKAQEHNARMTEIEQRLTQRRGDGGDPRLNTLGKSFVESDQFKNFNPSQRGKVQVAVKATITSSMASAPGSAGAMAGFYNDQPVALARQRPTIRELMPTIRITQGAAEVPVQKARNLAAAVVAEGNLKPQSDMEMELKSFPVRTIAHWMLASRQILADAPQLWGLIDSDLLYGLILAEEQQLLKGSGTGEDLYGMIPQAAAYAAPIELDASSLSLTRIDIIGLAMLQCSLADYPADGVVMHPSDWMRIRMTKDAQGKYIYGPPGEAVEPRIFGVRVVPTKAIDVDRFLVGQYEVAATIYDRQEANVMASTEDSDNFRRNLVTLLGEERIAFAVKRPDALVYGQFETALSA